MKLLVLICVIPALGAVLAAKQSASWQGEWLRGVGVRSGINNFVPENENLRQRLMLSLVSSGLSKSHRDVYVFAPAQDSKSHGQVAFDRVCKVCHGTEGRGDGAPALVPFDREYQEVIGLVREGRGEMPPISERRVSDEEVAQIVEYLYTLSKP